MSLYEIICELAHEPQKIVGGGFSDLLTFDLKHKNIRSKKLYIVENGKLAYNEIKIKDGVTYKLSDVPFLEESGGSFDKIQMLYDDFLNSKPSTRSDYANMNFRCKKSDELTFEQLVNGKDRNETKCRLEAYILLGSLSGIFEWPNKEHWFWKGKNGLVLYRDWIV